MKRHDLFGILGAWCILWAAIPPHQQTDYVLLAGAFFMLILWRRLDKEEQIEDAKNLHKRDSSRTLGGPF